MSASHTQRKKTDCWSNLLMINIRSFKRKLLIHPAGGQVPKPAICGSINTPIVTLDHFQMSSLSLQLQPVSSNSNLLSIFLFLFFFKSYRRSEKHQLLLSSSTDRSIFRVTHNAGISKFQPWVPGSTGSVVCLLPLCQVQRYCRYEVFIRFLHVLSSLGLLVQGHSGGAQAVCSETAWCQSAQNSACPQKALGVK